MVKPELLAPAGDMERLHMALAYGADAVYLAGNDFGMRAFAGNFDGEELKQAVELCHSKGVRLHVTCNTMARNDEIARLTETDPNLVAIKCSLLIKRGYNFIPQEYNTAFLK